MVHSPLEVKSIRLCKHILVNKQEKLVPKSPWRTPGGHIAYLRVCLIIYWHWPQAQPCSSHPVPCLWGSATLSGLYAMTQIYMCTPIGGPSNGCGLTREHNDLSWYVVLTSHLPKTSNEGGSVPHLMTSSSSLSSPQSCTAHLLWGKSTLLSKQWAP